MIHDPAGNYSSVHPLHPLLSAATQLIFVLLQDLSSWDDLTLYCLVLSDTPNTVQELVAMVVAAGDGGETVIEERLRSRKNDLPQQLW